MKISTINSYSQCNNNSPKTSFHGKPIPQVLSQLQNAEKSFNGDECKFLVSYGKKIGDLTSFKFDGLTDKLTEVCEVVANKITKYILGKDGTASEIIKSNRINGVVNKKVFNFDKTGNVKNIEFSVGGTKTKFVEIIRKEKQPVSLKEYVYTKDGEDLAELNVYDLSMGKRVKRLSFDYFNPNKDETVKVYSNNKILFHTNLEDGIKMQDDFLLGVL